VASKISLRQILFSQTDDINSEPATISTLITQVDVVDSFVYLRSCTDSNAGNDHDIQRRTELARTCMKVIDCGIWN